MDVKTPTSVRIDVIRRWLENGKSPDYIARELNLGAGTVSVIIKEVAK